ncbi:hypothetical protein R3P38DRAFT_1600065 [Favolaschia claudopus]|uniref:Uncharacterized protein n=1 Tax=Favolaschia claudopus TaxID=2862362 RepID=A0AAW0AG81_9AGAR
MSTTAAHPQPSVDYLPLTPTTSLHPRYAGCACQVHDDTLGTLDCFAGQRRPQPHSSTPCHHAVSPLSPLLPKPDLNVTPKPPQLPPPLHSIAFPRRSRNADADNAPSAITTPRLDLSLSASRSTVLPLLGSRPRRLSRRRLVDTSSASVNLDSCRSRRRHFRPPPAILEHRRLTYVANRRSPYVSASIPLPTLLPRQRPPTLMAPSSLDAPPHRLLQSPSTSTQRHRRHRGTRPPRNPAPHRLKHAVSIDAAAAVNPANLDLLKNCAAKLNLNSSN